MAEKYEFTTTEGEIAYLRLLLHQKGITFDDADRALDTYEMDRRLADKHERNLLLDYGLECIADDIYNKKPIGDSWLAHESLLFSLKDIALSRSRYHILAQAYKQRQSSVD